MSRRYYRALFALPDGSLAVFHFTAPGDSLAFAHASYCLTMADDWPKGMDLREVSFTGLEAPRAELGSLIAPHLARKAA